MTTLTTGVSQRTYQRRWQALSLLALAQFVVILDATIVNIALPAIGRGLHMQASELSWVIDAYLLTFGGLLLLGGRAADLLGRRRVFLGGLLAFSAASLADALAPTGGALIAFRAIQGAGAAAMSPAALSILTTLFPQGPERARALGVWGAVAGSGSAAGVLLGGVLTQAFGWPAIFYINVPVGIVAAVLTPRLIPPLRPAEVTRARIDLPGAVLVTGGLAAVVYGLIQGSEAGWSSARTLVSLAVGAVLLALFVVVEHRTENPLVPLRIFALRTVSSANTVMLLTGAAIVSLFFFLSLYMQQVLGYTPLKAGLTQLPLAVVLIAAAGAAPALIAAIGRKVTLAAGLAVLAGGLAWFTQVPVAGTYAGSILGPSLLVGIGLGLAFVPINAIAVSGVADGDTGLASGVINTSQQAGGALGLAIASAVATAQIAHLLPQAATAPDRLAALTSGYQMGFLASAAFASAAALVTLIAVPGGKDGERA
ncbi:MAG TPA: DHA2 family efflux MFS transporter permease subunit [Trebonia sp.]|jgi:EmrB/QacA subfamily drug resistance transporter